MPTIDEVTGLVLSGGRGLRIGGMDKGLLRLDGLPLAAHAVAMLRPHAARVLISANRHLETYRALADGVVADRRPGFPGPLAGLEAGLAAAQSPMVLLCPCDAVPLPSGLPAALLQPLARAPEIEAVVAHDGDSLQPLVSAVRRSALAGVTCYLDGGRRSVRGWLSATAYTVVRWPVTGGFPNRNRLLHEDAP